MRCSDVSLAITRLFDFPLVEADSREVFSHEFSCTITDVPNVRSLPPSLVPSSRKRTSSAAFQR